MAHPEWLRVDRLFGEWKIGQDTTAGRRALAAGMEGRRREELDGEFKAVRRGWYLGGKEFRRELLEQISEQRGEWHYGHELIEAGEAKVEGIIRQALTRKGWAEKELKSRRKGDPFKVALAAKLRGQTTATVGWIAEHLSMGTRGHLAHLLHQWTREQGKTAPFEVKWNERI